MKTILKLFVFANLGCGFVVQADSTERVSGFEYRWVSGSKAHAYYDRALKNDYLPYTDWENQMSRKKDRVWRAKKITDMGGPLTPKPSVCSSTLLVSNRVQPVLSDAWHSIQNGQAYGDREECVIPSIKVDCQKKTWTFRAPEYQCALEFRFGGMGDAAVVRLKEINLANTLLEASPEVFEFKRCSDSKLQ